MNGTNKESREAVRVMPQCRDVVGNNKQMREQSNNILSTDFNRGFANKVCREDVKKVLQ